MGAHDFSQGKSVQPLEELPLSSALQLAVISTSALPVLPGYAALCRMLAWCSSSCVYLAFAAIQPSHTVWVILFLSHYMLKRPSCRKAAPNMAAPWHQDLQPRPKKNEMSPVSHKMWRPHAPVIGKLAVAQPPAVLSAPCRREAGSPSCLKTQVLSAHVRWLVLVPTVNSGPRRCDTVLKSLHCSFTTSNHLDWRAGKVQAEHYRSATQLLQLSLSIALCTARDSWPTDASTARIVYPCVLT